MVKLKKKIAYTLYLGMFQHLALVLFMGVENNWFMASFYLASLCGLMLVLPKLPIWEYK